MLTIEKTVYKSPCHIVGYYYVHQSIVKPLSSLHYD